MTLHTRIASFAADLWGSLGDYVGVGRPQRRAAIVDRASLQAFLESRASFVAQTSLYGYLRTRAGMRYPELFDDDRFVLSINIAKWHVWLACLSDLAIYTGGLIARRSRAPAADVGRLINGCVEEILGRTGVPADAGEEFASHAGRVRARIALCDWTVVQDDDTPFAESPMTLVRRAPIVDDLKRLDEAIVLNSVRFRWQEVRRHLRRDLDAERVLADVP
ncbi:MAG: hypothetical protein AB7O31_15730 [Burkholderiales bacterium]